MKDLKGKVAVITGAASGIGRAMVDRFAREGMQIVLADIEEKALLKTEEELKAAGRTVLSVQTDVTKPEEVDALAKKTIDIFGVVHLVCNNAGVVVAGTDIWDNTLADWKWTTNVNMWGMIHGVRTFVPIMIEQDIDCHIVNTASLAGLVAAPGLGIYTVTKYAIVGLSEVLYHELARRGAKVRVSVLCPSLVNTNLMNADRNRPPELLNDPSEVKLSPEFEAMGQMADQLMQSFPPPQQVADCVCEAVMEDKFYILPHPEWTPFVQTRMEDIIQGRNPTGMMP
ncbi:MAG: SDR family NAD(P)-dependent oxidoreductase [Chloroflexota bacterium]|nr:SDR family NAD(P)-dependent oxidoreductase [Chloroflexota bacterium]